VLFIASNSGASSMLRAKVRMPDDSIWAAYKQQERIGMATHIDRAVVKLFEYLCELVVKGGNGGPDFAGIAFGEPSCRHHQRAGQKTHLLLD